ncbi:MAG: CoA transferase, partial [Polyangiaceae bacterium]
IEAWCKVRTRQDVLDTLIPLGCAIGPLETIDTVLDNPQIRHRRSFIDVDDPVFGTMKMLRPIPDFLNSEPGHVKTGPSQVGEDTAALLERDLGLSQAEVADLRARGIVLSHK